MKWTYVSRGHYSAPDGKGGTVHVVGDAVYITHPRRDTVDVTGARAKRYIEAVRGKSLPSVRPKTVPSKKSTKKPTKSAKKKVRKVAKAVAKGAGAAIGTIKAFSEMVGEAEETAYKKRAAVPAKKHKRAQRQRAPTLEEWMGY